MSKKRKTGQAQAARRRNVKTPQRRSGGASAYRSSGKPRQRQSGGKNPRRPVRDEKNIFFIILEIIVLLFKKFFRLLKRAAKGAAEKIFSPFKKIDLSYFGDSKFAVLAVGSCALLILIAALVWGFTNKNAYEVYIGDTAMGVIRANKNVTAETLTSTVVGRISSDLGLKINPSDQITIKNIHASNKQLESDDALITKLIGTFNYQAEVLSVTLEGQEVALLKNDAEYENVKNRLIAPYRKTGAVTVSEDFAENLTTTKRYANMSELITTDKAYELLSAKYPYNITYVVKSGDNLGPIAESFGTSVEAILELNNLTYDIIYNLPVGKELKIASQKPLLTVVIVEEIKYKEVKPYETTTQLNPSKGAGHREILQQGADGEAEITAHITTVNGLEQSREIVNEEITVPSINEVVEIGAN